MQAVAGFNFTCALTHEGTIRCWGANDTGQLGVGSVDGLCWDASTIPAPTNVVSFANDTVHIEAGFSHSCAMSETGGVACWGANTAGQLGIGNTNHIGDGVGELPAASVALNDTTRTVQIATGGAHSCALSGTGRVRCWGLGTKGQLGYGNTNNIGTKPGEVPPPAIDLGHATVVTQLAVGFAHTCALTTAHTVKCWGDGAAGQLGYGNTQAVGDAPGEMPPPDVDLGDSVTPVQIAAGNDSTCILTDAGAIKCWGFGTVTNIPVPTGVVIGDDETPANGGWIVLGQSVTASAIALGEFHGCALVGVDAVKCWGGRFVFSVTGGALVDVNGTQTPDLVAPIILE
jgi:alpha-tubulin suppressor-like RCC1 family protein